MFIRTVTKKNKQSPKRFTYQYLVESVRTAKGPRQKFLLNLGKLDVPKAQWSLLAQRIEEILYGQEELFASDPQIERLATHYAHKYLINHEAEYNESEEKHYESVAVDSVSSSRLRTVGAEYVSLSWLKKLALDGCLRDCGLNDREVQVATLLLIGRLVSPGSERHTHRWAQHTSGLDELLGTDFSSLSLNTLYKVSDTIERNKAVIEKHLCEKERDLFGLDEQIILYDLTNTFFEGQAFLNPKAKFGRSKEKRHDCRLLTLGLVIDGKGFPKTSKVFAGNQSEPKTLVEMITVLREADPSHGNHSKKRPPKKPTVVIDAGLATDDNLKALGPDYHYICVSRKKMELPQSATFILIKKDKKNKVEAQQTTCNGEVVLYCKSQLKEGKEKAIQGRLVQLFEDQLRHIAESIHRKGCTKKYQKVCERIGRLREKYSKIAQFYTISVEEKEGLANSVTWQYIKDKSDQRFSGSYYLRTDRTDLTEKQIWELYTMLNDLEDAFRTMKTELELRPIHHQKQVRSDAHIFITVCAYHILHSIRTTFKQSGITYRWKTIRDLLASHGRVTTRMKTKAQKVIYIRKCSEPEPFHKTIYDALHLTYEPCKPKKVTLSRNP